MDKESRFDIATRRGRAKAGGTDYRLCIQNIGHSMVVLRGSNCDMCSRVVDIKETKFRISCWL